MSEKKFIDIDKIVGGKNPRVLKILPAFILKYLKRITHQDELNVILNKFEHIKGVEFVDNIFKEFNITIQTKGLENINPEGRYIIVSNHPLGGLDGMALINVAGKIKPNIKFPVNDLLMNLPNLAPLFIPINKHGSNKNNIKIIEDTFASDANILYFPAGLCSRKINGKIIDLEWKKTFVSKARQHHREVIPAYIDGQNSNFFYNLSNTRKILGIKVNIEMLYLVDEMFKSKNKTININFGVPIKPIIFDNSKTDLEWANFVREIVYNLK